ncbi:MAG: hypothetical protein JW751_25785 [Polyangiaceae bacterium]|nr:hypothetical protein [Polyangiaceae bacterium]
MRNRLAACELAGVDPWIVRWSGTGSVVMWIASKNLHRRRLTDAQRALAAGKMAALLAEEARSRSARNLRNCPEIVEGRNSALRAAGRSEEVAAAVHGVTVDSAKKAAKILKTGDEQLVAAVTKGTVSLDAAAAVAGLPKKQQRRIVEGGKVKEAARRIRKEKVAKTQNSKPEAKVTTARAAKPAVSDNNQDEAPMVEPPAHEEDEPDDEPMDDNPLVRSAHQAIDEMVRAAEEAGKLDQIDGRLLAVVNYCGKVTRSFIEVDLPPMISSA